MKEAMLAMGISLEFPMFLHRFSGPGRYKRRTFVVFEEIYGKICGGSVSVNC